MEKQPTPRTPSPVVTKMSADLGTLRMLLDSDDIPGVPTAQYRILDEFCEYFTVKYPGVAYDARATLTWRRRPGQVGRPDLLCVIADRATYIPATGATLAGCICQGFVRVDLSASERMWVSLDGENLTDSVIRVAQAERARPAQNSRALGRNLALAALLGSWGPLPPQAQRDLLASYQAALAGPPVEVVKCV